MNRSLSIVRASVKVVEIMFKLDLSNGVATYNHETFSSNKNRGKRKFINRLNDKYNKRSK